MTKAAKGDIKVLQDEQALRYTFTPEERTALVEKMVGAMDEEAGLVEALDRIIEGMKGVKTEYSTKITEVQARVGALAHRIRDGFELRNTPVEKRLNCTTGLCTVVRLDTGEVVEERPLADSERQLALEMKGADSKGE